MYGCIVLIVLSSFNWICHCQDILMRSDPGENVSILWDITPIRVGQYHYISIQQNKQVIFFCLDPFIKPCQVNPRGLQLISSPRITDGDTIVNKLGFSIFDVTSLDSGHYGMEVVSSLGYTEYRDAALYVYSPPTKPVITGSMEALEGDTITLECTSTLQSNPEQFRSTSGIEFTWHIKRSDDSISRVTENSPESHVVNESVLIISEVTRNSSRSRYSCSAQEWNSVVTSNDSDDVIPDVLYIDSVWILMVNASDQGQGHISQDKMKTLQGEYFELLCVSECNPACSHVWSSDSLQTKKTGSTLRLFAMTPGVVMYVCNATNIVGTNSASAVVEVIRNENLTSDTTPAEWKRTTSNLEVITKSERNTTDTPAFLTVSTNTNSLPDDVSTASVTEVVTTEPLITTTDAMNTTLEVMSTTRDIFRTITDILSSVPELKSTMSDTHSTSMNKMSTDPFENTSDSFKITSSKSTTITEQESTTHNTTDSSSTEAMSISNTAGDWDSTDNSWVNNTSWNTTPIISIPDFYSTTYAIGGLVTPVEVCYIPSSVCRIQDLSPVVLGVAAAIILCIIILIIIIIVCCLRASRRKKKRKEDRHSYTNGTTLVNNENMHNDTIVELQNGIHSKSEELNVGNHVNKDASLIIQENGKDHPDALCQGSIMSLPADTIHCVPNGHTGSKNSGHVPNKELQDTRTSEPLSNKDQALTNPEALNEIGSVAMQKDPVFFVPGNPDNDTASIESGLTCGSEHNSRTGPVNREALRQTSIISLPTDTIAYHHAPEHSNNEVLMSDVANGREDHFHRLNEHCTIALPMDMLNPGHDAPVNLSGNPMDSKRRREDDILINYPDMAIEERAQQPHASHVDSTKYSSAGKDPEQHIFSRDTTSDLISLDNEIPNTASVNDRSYPNGTVMDVGNEPVIPSEIQPQERFISENITSNMISDTSDSHNECSRL